MSIENALMYLENPSANKIKVGDVTLDISFEQSDLDTIGNHTPGDDTEHLYRTTPEEYTRTGNLKRGFEIVNNGTRIINDVHYAAYVEFGTSRMMGHFMVQKSLKEIDEGLEVRLLKELQSKKIMSDIKIKCRIRI